MSSETEEMSFWDHLDVLRGTLFRSALAIVSVSVVMLCFKRVLFDDIILAPSRQDFFIYRWFGEEFSMELINTEISAQFFVHLKVSFICGFVLSFPYVIYEVWKFIAPALYENEKISVSKAFLSSAVLFYLGVATGFCLIFPITLSFFQGYTVSDSIANTITLNSYISMFSSMVILFGIVFEFPVLIAILSNMGLITRDTLKQYRKHAAIGILVVAAIITPADPFSMMIAAAPLYILYELSVLVCVKN
ncbi:MAG: twin-arginine translocase subunit TatC [Bacteroidales bacterium]|nr:twin-arginine translocase subunit TatC [Bacteroidales bacterium]